MAGNVGLEPTLARLTAESFTIKLIAHKSAFRSALTTLMKLRPFILRTATKTPFCRRILSAGKWKCQKFYVAQMKLGNTNPTFTLLLKFLKYLYKIAAHNFINPTEVFI